MKKASSFLRFYAIYSCIFILPILLLSFFLHAFLLQWVQKESILQGEQTVENIRQSLDGQFRGMTEIGDRILYESNALKPFSLFIEKTPVQKASVIAGQLQAYSSPYSLFEEVGIYFHGDEFIYTTSSIYTLELFNRLFPTDGSEQGEGVDFTRNTTLRVGHSPFLRGDSLILVSMESANHIPLSMFYLIDTERIREFLRALMPAAGDNLLIIGSDGDLLFSYCAPSLEMQTALQEHSPLGEKGFQRLTVGEGAYYLFECRSMTADYTYMLLMDERELLRNPRKIQWVYMAGVLSLLFVEGLLLYLAFWMIYRPLRQLKQYSQRALPEAQAGDDFDVIRAAIDGLLFRNSLLKTQIAESAVSARNYLIYSLVKGEIESVSSFNEQGKPYGMLLNRSHCRVASLILRMPEKDETAGSQALAASIIENNLPENVEGFCAFGLEDNRYILLLSYDDETSLRSELPTLCEILHRVLNAEATLGLSQPSAGVLSFPEAYIQSMTAVRYGFIVGYGRVIYFDEIDLEPQPQEYWPHEVRELHSAVLMGDAIKVEEVCLRFREYIRRSSHYQESVRRLYYDITEIIEEAACTTQTEKPSSLALPAVEQLTTVDDFISAIRDSCMACCRICAQDSFGEEGFAEEVRRFIRINYVRPDFSIQEIADYFHMNLSNLSHLFKSKTGVTLQNELIHLRMDLAKEMLRRRCSIEEISAKLGYQNASSFIRRFRNITGMTPGEYRSKTPCGEGEAEGSEKRESSQRDS